LEREEKIRKNLQGRRGRTIPPDCPGRKKRLARGRGRSPRKERRDKPCVVMFGGRCVNDSREKKGEKKTSAKKGKNRVR